MKTLPKMEVNSSEENLSNFSFSFSYRIVTKFYREDLL